MTIVPSLLRCVRHSLLVKASRNAALSGQGRNTLGPARKRTSGASPVSSWTLRLYSNSTHAWVASLRNSKVRSGTSSSMAISRPSTWLHKFSILPFTLGLYGSVGLCRTAEAAEALHDLGGGHCRAFVAHRFARQPA